MTFNVKSENIAVLTQNNLLPHLC